MCWVLAKSKLWHVSVDAGGNKMLHQKAPSRCFLVWPVLLQTLDMDNYTVPGYHDVDTIHNAVYLHNLLVSSGKMRS